MAQFLLRAWGRVPLLARYEDPRSFGIKAGVARALAGESEARDPTASLRPTPARTPRPSPCRLPHCATGPCAFFVGRMGGDTVAPTCHPRMPPGRACEQAPHSQERHPNLDLDPDPNLNGRVGVVLPSACLLLLALCLQWEASASGCPSWWKMRRRRRPCGRLSPARDQLPRDWALTTAVAATLAVVHGMASV